MYINYLQLNCYVHTALQCINLSVAIVQCALLHTSLCTLVQNVHLCMIALAQGALVQQLIEFMILFVA